MQIHVESEVLLEQAMAQTCFAICFADLNWDDQPTVFVNRAFRELTGYNEEEIIGRNCRFLPGPATDLTQVHQLREAFAPEGVVGAPELPQKRHRLMCRPASRPISNEDGSIPYLFGSQWDVTDVHIARADRKHARIYEPGYLHVDGKYLPQMADEDRRRYLLVVIIGPGDGPSCVSTRPRPPPTPAAFSATWSAAPMRITRVLTGNGKEFTDRLLGLRKRAATGNQDFDRLCAELGIEHRLAPPMHPPNQRNGGTLQWPDRGRPAKPSP